MTVHQTDSVAGLDRREFLRRSAIAAAIGGAALATPAFTGVAWADDDDDEDDDGKRLRVDVKADVTLFAQVETPAGSGNGPFYVPGDIFKRGADTATADPIGRFQCWGWLTDGGDLGVVSQEYHLFGKGKIQVQGIEDDGRRAVVGGTGRFRNARGQMIAPGFPAGFPPFFSADFHLSGDDD